jgi:hypothetical protein
LATPLVVSVHTVVSFDFTVAIVPGWHSTIFPPYFVAGAIYSGFAMVVTLAIPAALFLQVGRLRHPTPSRQHGEDVAGTGMIVAYGYVFEFFTSWYSDDPYEMFVALNRAWGPYKYYYWALIFCNILAPQLLWISRVRRNVKALFGLALIINVGMWLERFIIVVTSLHRDFLTSSWGMYAPTRWDWTDGAASPRLRIAGGVREARAANGRGASRSRSRLSADGRVHAVSRRRPRRSVGAPLHARAVDHADWRLGGRLERIRAAILGVEDGVSDQRRRAAIQ